jgi:hypothetical protein
VVWNGDKALLPQGNHILMLDVSSLNSGVYFYNVTINGTTNSGKMLVR